MAQFSNRVKQYQKRLGSTILNDVELARWHHENYPVVDNKRGMKQEQGPKLSLKRLRSFSMQNVELLHQYAFCSLVTISVFGVHPAAKAMFPTSCRTHCHFGKGSALPQPYKFSKPSILLM